MDVHNDIADAHFLKVYEDINMYITCVCGTPLSRRWVHLTLITPNGKFLCGRRPGGFFGKKEGDANDVTFTSLEHFLDVTKCGQ